LGRAVADELGSRGTSVERHETFRFPRHPRPAAGSRRASDREGSDQDDAQGPSLAAVDVAWRGSFYRSRRSCSPSGSNVPLTVDSAR